MWFLIKNWKLVGIGLVILACGLYVATLKVQLHSIASDLKAARGEIGKLSVAVSERDALITTQNGYVEAWKAAAVKNQAARQSAEERARKMALEAAKAPILNAPPIQDNCSCALPREKWLTDQLNSLLWPR